MISHLLDTNAVIDLLAGRSERLAQRILSAAQGSIGLSSIVAHELFFGARKSTRVEHNLETVRLLLEDFPLLDFGRNDAFVAGEIRALLAFQGKPIVPYDALIAGQAKARGFTFVTRNTGEFAGVAGLHIEDWTI